MESSLNPAGMFRRAWGRAPVPVWGGMSGLHVWFYRMNKNLLPLSYGEVWAAQICPVAPMRRANGFCLRIYYTALSTVSIIVLVASYLLLVGS